MNFRLIDAGWDKVFDESLRKERSSIRIVCPFIKKRPAERLLKHGKPELLQVITRFDLCAFSDGVSDLDALQLLLKSGALIRGVRNLHSKLYLFGKSRVILTSANLTEAALLRNHEFGFVAEDSAIAERCLQYFEDLWGRAGRNLSAERLLDWENKVTNYLAAGARPATATGLGDEGVEAGLSTEPIVFPAWEGGAGQAFVKFFGEGNNRAESSITILEEVKRSGSHWACSYPRDKRPRQVKDGAIMFMGRLVKEPNDILIFGRAVGMKHEPGRDDATPADVQQRSWKERWPHYVRVHHAEFIAGNLTNGISLDEMMGELKSDSFVATQRNVAKGLGNIDPRKAYMQQAAVELSTQGFVWLNERLECAFLQHGKIAPKTLEELDWPKVP